jgi:hypothetical protein
MISMLISYLFSILPISPPAIAGGTDCIQQQFLTFEAKLVHIGGTKEHVCSCKR